MISLSNLIKSAHYITLDKKKQIQDMHSFREKPETVQDSFAEKGKQIILEQAMKEKNNILETAQQEAQQLLKQASKEAEQMKAQTQLDLEDWIEAQKLQEEKRLAEKEQTAYDQGYEKGLEKAARQMKEKYATMIGEAEEVLQLAYARKDEIILEAEPFLLELSVEIASKVLQQTLDDKQEIILDYFKKLLSNREGQITLCVAPQHFAYIMDFREELEAVIDAEAKLHIIPDRSVTDHGCMIRSSFGTMDARFDTQLNEIKKALLQVVQEGGDQDEAG